MGKWVPPAVELKKYMYGASARMANKNFLKDKQIKDRKLAHHLQSLSSSAKAASTKAYEHDHLLLPQTASRMMEAENEMEKTWRVTQDEIAQASAISTRGKRFSLKLDQFGPYDIDFTRNGRHVAIAGRKGHVGTFDWQTGTLHTELHLRETARAIRWLHDESFFAVAQKKYVYIYDKQGLEVHQLKNHIDVLDMQFLPYHFLLATVGNTGYLKYQDTSTGQQVAEHRTKLGSCGVMAQNLHNAFIHLGHQNGTVTLWSPSVPRAQVQLLAHQGPVSSIAIDPSTMGQRMVTASLDGTVKLWDTRKWAVLDEYHFKKTPRSTSFSQKGLLAVGWGSHVGIYSDLLRSGQKKQARMPPRPYMTHTLPSCAISSVAFCPFDDVLGVGHERGIDSLVVPGAAEANFDTLEADPFEGKRRRREREVNMLLDKVPFDMITLDPEGLVGKVDTATTGTGTDDDDGGVPFARKTRFERIGLQGKRHDEEDEDMADESDVDIEEGEGAAARRKRRDEKARRADEKKRARGRNSTLKKALRKRDAKNVVDAQTLKLKEKIEKRRELAQKAKKQAKLDALNASGTAGALDRFTV